MTNSGLSKILRSHLIPEERYIFGFADLRGLLDEKFSEYPYGISIGCKLDDEIIDKITEAPTLEYLDHFTEINLKLQAVCEDVVAELKDCGILAMAVKPTISTDPETFDRLLPNLRYEVSHKMVATRAGLGWIGKTDLFISTKFGARLRLASILINHEIKLGDEPIEKSRCGKCIICVEKCPAGAATGQLWDIHTDRDVFFNAYRCREQCIEFGRTHLKIDRRICGICVAVCRVGRNAAPGPRSDGKNKKR